MQALAVNALEPEWEARFEPKSYGFRPGRGCDDAIVAIHTTSRGKQAKRLWVLDADLQAAFDQLSHDHILGSLGAFPGRGMVRQWLRRVGWSRPLHNGQLLFRGDAGLPAGGAWSVMATLSWEPGTVCPWVPVGPVEVAPSGFAPEAEQERILSRSPSTSSTPRRRRWRGSSQPYRHSPWFSPSSC